MIRAGKLLLIFLICLTLVGCSDSNPTVNTAKGPYVYYINSAFTSLVSDTFSSGTAKNVTYDDYISALGSVPSGEGYISPLSDIVVLDTTLDEGKLTIEFGRDYKSLKGTKELLVRCAIVKTLVQSDDVNTVEFVVSGKPLTNDKDEEIGPMDKDTFVDYFGKDQDNLLSENLTIYYASEDGANLFKETHRVYFENTLSLEQAVIRFMKDNPESKSAKSAISSNTNIINITTTDGICYLDMDLSFYDANSNVSPNIAIMAIVNSLCELDGIRQVQVSILDPNTGDISTDTLMDSLTGTYEKNLEIVIN